MKKKQYSKKEVAELLSALERQATDVLSLATKAEEEANKHSYEMYGKFRRKVSQFDTLSILIEGRLKNVNVDIKALEELEEQYDVLKVLVLNGLIKASIKFFFVISASTTLPLGAKDIFLSELRRLHNSRRELDNPKYESRIDDEARQNLDMAEDILAEIIDKAPSLLDFDD